MQAATLPTTGPPPPPTTIRVGGWGKTKAGGPSSTTYLAAEVQIRSSETCRDVWGSRYTPGMFCAGSTTATPCGLGDYGAGGMVGTPGQVIVGVMVGTKFSCDKPALFAPIYKHVAWISNR